MSEQTISTKLFIFRSVLDFTHFVNRSIEVHKSELSRYEDELGMMLRQATQDDKTNEWANNVKSKLNQEGEKPVDAKEKEGKDKKEMKDKKDKKDKKELKVKKGKSKNAKNWASYKELSIFTGDARQGKTEVYFEAVNELKVEIDKLNKIKETVNQLINAGISNAFYLVYAKNGIPEKLILLPQQTQELDRFEFKADFITKNVEVPLESMES